MIEQNIVWNGSLLSNVVFEKEVIFQEFDFETSDLEFEVPKFSIWKHTTSFDEGVYSSIIIAQFQRPIELKLSQVRFLCICWETPSERTSLWQLPIVSNIFKHATDVIIILIYTLVIIY